MAPTIHIVRHARALHQEWSGGRDPHESYNIYRDVHDPELSHVGISECQTLATEMAVLGEITMVIASPMKRTIQTAIAAFPSFTQSKQIVLHPDLQETGYGMVNTGSSPEELIQRFGTKLIDYRYMTRDWTEKGPESRYNPVYVKERARAFRLLLRAAMQSYKDTNAHIVLVTHAMFAQYLAPAEWSLFKNVEWRSYRFDQLTGTDEEASIHELPCSVTRRLQREPQAEYPRKPEAPVPTQSDANLGELQQRRDYETPQGCSPSDKHEVFCPGAVPGTLWAQFGNTGPFRPLPSSGTPPQGPPPICTTPNQQHDSPMIPWSARSPRPRNENLLFGGTPMYEGRTRREPIPSWAQPAQASETQKEPAPTSVTPNQQSGPLLPWFAKTPPLRNANLLFGGTPQYEGRTRREPVPDWAKPQGPQPKKPTPPPAAINTSGLPWQQPPNQTNLNFGNSPPYTPSGTVQNPSGTEHPTIDTVMSDSDTSGQQAASHTSSFAASQPQYSGTGEAGPTLKAAKLPVVGAWGEAWDSYMQQRDAGIQTPIVPNVQDTASVKSEDFPKSESSDESIVCDVPVDGTVFGSPADSSDSWSTWYPFLS
ncbi:histidine phosphatase superfamily [Nemania abortiva]|nr:histidine phosphatase superfamily [Nemania abortiva]